MSEGRAEVMVFAEVVGSNGKREWEPLIVRSRLPGSDCSGARDIYGLGNDFGPGSDNDDGVLAAKSWW